MKHLSLLTTLLLTSSMVHADWIQHDYNPETAVYTSIPKYSCLEMICESGCSENTETGEGICCPEPRMESCISEQFDEYNCPLCKVVLPCPENASETISSWQIGTSGCYCNPGYIINETGDACVEGCSSYKDCANGEFCDMTGNITDCKTRPTAGTCRKANKKRIFPGYDFYTYDGKTTRGKYKNTGGMDWFSAMDFCAAIGEPTVSYKDYCPNETTSSRGACVGYRGIDDCPAFKIGINSNDYWLADLAKNNDCYAYDLTFGADLCAGNGTDKTKDYDNDSPRYALCGKVIEGKSCPANSSKTKTDQPIGTTGCYCKEGYFATQEGYCSTCPDEFSQEMTKTANYKKRYLEYTWTNPYQCDYDVYFNSGSHITVEYDCKGSKDGGDERLTLLIGDTYVYNNSKTICPRYNGEKVGTVYHNTNNTIYIQGKNPGGHKGFSINATFKRKK